MLLNGSILKRRKVKAMINQLETRLKEVGEDIARAEKDWDLNDPKVLETYVCLVDEREKILKRLRVRD